MGQLPDFEELKLLAESDPEAFDAYRQSVCEAFIDSIPYSHQQRLRAVQFRVNRVIHGAKTPMAGLIKVSGMMHDSLYSLSCKLYELGNDPTSAVPAPRAEVVELTAWRQHRDNDSSL